MSKRHAKPTTAVLVHRIYRKQIALEHTVRELHLLRARQNVQLARLIEILKAKP